MLEQRYQKHRESIDIIARSEFKPLPEYKDRDSWGKAHAMFRQYWIGAAEARVGKAWGELSATKYMEFFVNGNLQGFNTMYTERRYRLLSLMIAECIEGKGRFLNDIIDGVWVICEESSWTTPSHNNHMYAEVRNILPDVEIEFPFVDIRAAEAASLVAWVSYFFKEKLDEISPLIHKRIVYEVKRKVLDPYLNRTDFKWMGLEDDRSHLADTWTLHRVNNWNPWIVSNCLSALFILEDDQEIRRKGLEKSLAIVDKFLIPYPGDGGCDEGPTYWKFAGASLFDALEIISYATQGKLDLFNEQKIQNMGSYIYKAHIDKDKYVNFADATARISQPSLLIHRYGCRINDERMKALGLSGLPYVFEDYETRSMSNNVFRKISDVVTDPEIIDQQVEAPYIHDAWFSDIQIMVAREHEGSTKGFFLAAKGGHNDESHNHNDVGNFIVNYDGEPIIIDIGVESYNAKSFSNERYEMYTMQSAYHNLPTVNRKMQKDGSRYKAVNVNCERTPELCQLSLDIEAAYPVEAGIKKWSRKIQLNRGADPSIEISDQFTMSEATNDIEWTLMTKPKPVVEDGKITIAGSEHYAMVMSYSSDLMTARVEEMKITDPWLLHGWGEVIYRIVFKRKAAAATGEFLLTINKNHT